MLRNIHLSKGKETRDKHVERDDKGAWRGMDWIDLAQDRNRGRAVVNSIMNICVA
jgi:hypothetical protein